MPLVEAIGTMLYEKRVDITKITEANGRPNENQFLLQIHKNIFLQKQRPEYLIIENSFSLRKCSKQDYI